MVEPAIQMLPGKKDEQLQPAGSSMKVLELSLKIRGQRVKVGRGAWWLTEQLLMLL